jgi:hypothetical protein
VELLLILEGGMGSSEAEKDGLRATPSEMEGDGERVRRRRKEGVGDGGEGDGECCGEVFLFLV